MPEWTEDDFDEVMKDSRTKKGRESKTVDDSEEDETIAPIFRDLDVGVTPKTSTLDELLDEDDVEAAEPPQTNNEKAWAAAFGDELPVGFKQMSKTEFVSALNELKELASGNIRRAHEQQPPPPPPPTLDPVFAEDDFGLASGVNPKTIEDKLDRFFAARMGPLNQQLNGLRAQQSMLYVSRRLPHWGRYENEIMQEGMKQPAAELVSGNGWLTAYSNVTARHFDEVKALEAAGRQKAEPPPVERGGGAPTTTTEDSDKVTLTSRDRKMADLLNVDPKVYLAGKIMRERQKTDA